MHLETAADTTMLRDTLPRFVNQGAPALGPPRARKKWRKPLLSTRLAGPRGRAAKRAPAAITQLQPTGGIKIMPGEQRVTLAFGRDFSDVTPVRGVIMGGGQHAVQVAVDVEPVDVAG